jgi:hypothetical protein
MTDETPHDAHALLTAIDTLDRPARMRLVARTARELAGTPALAPLLAELATGGTFERGLMLTMARIASANASASTNTGSDGNDGNDGTSGSTNHDTITTTTLLPLLTDPDFTLRVSALNALITTPHHAHDQAILTTLHNAPIAWQRALIRAINRARRRDLADHLLLTAAATPPPLPDHLLIRLLPTSSETVAARQLPALAHLPLNWKRLGAAHPRAVLAHISDQLDSLPDGPRTRWWTKTSAAVAAAAPAEPGQVLALLERHHVWRRVTFPAALTQQLGHLADHSPERTLRLLLDAAISAGGKDTGSPLKVTTSRPPWARHARGARMSRRVRRLLLLDAPAEALRWGRLYGTDDLHLAALLKTLPPSQRDTFFDAVTAGRDLSNSVLDEELLDALPHARRHREARRILTLPDLEHRRDDRLEITARLPWAEGREPLLAETRVADAAARGAAYPLLIACVAAERDPAVFTRFLDQDLTRLRNEQDPVRQPTLKALAHTSPALFGTAAVPALTRLATDTVEARDTASGTLTALRQLARRILVHHAESGDTALLTWCLDVLEQVEGSTDTVDRERLDTLRHGQERAVVDVLTPWVRRGLDRAQYGRLLSLATALDRRAHAMPDVQGWLAETIWNSTAATAQRAIPLWLDDPEHRDERVEALVRWDPSVAKIPRIADVISRRRTDLLDPYLTGNAPAGRFAAEQIRWFPSFAGNAPDNWLPRQRVQYAKLLTRVARDTGSTASARANAIHRSARLGAAGAATVERFLSSTNVVLQEAALGAMVWLPDPAAAIPKLLEFTDGDRARVAVYALTRAAQYTSPSGLEQQLRSVLSSPTAKVTSRKEALRIAAQAGVPHLVDLLLDTWNSEGQHRHVRMAAVTRLVAELDDPRVWPVLVSATVADQDVASELLRTGTFEVPVRHRAGYGDLVARLCSHPEPLVRSAATMKAAAWYPWAPQVAEAVEADAVDVSSTALLPIYGVAGLIAAGWPTDRYLDMVRKLMAAAAAERDDATATASTSTETATAARTEPAEAPFRDRPARRRLEFLATNLSAALGGILKDWQPVVSATATVLAADPVWLFPAARLHMQALDLLADPDHLTADVRALADLTDGRPAAATVAAEALTARTFRTGSADPIAPSSFHAAAAALATDPRASAGILAIALAATAGPGSGWDPAWRAVVATLRTHPDADVAESALRLTMTRV